MDQWFPRKTYIKIKKYDFTGKRFKDFYAIFYVQRFFRHLNISKNYFM